MTETESRVYAATYAAVLVLCLGELAMGSAAARKMAFAEALESVLALRKSRV